MAIFHFNVKIIGRSRGKSIISASAYINGTTMKDLESGQTFSYKKKKEVVYSSILLCANAPPKWKELSVPKAKEILWNEVLKRENKSNSQLARSLEFALPKEWGRDEQIRYATEYIKENFVEKGMCADFTIHDKGTGNPHVHCLLTMRPFKDNHEWGAKEKKGYVLDKDGNRIPVIDPATGKQKLGKRNEKLWKRGLVDSTGWNNPKNCKEWRKAWADKCNEHLEKENRIDHRSFEEQGIMDIPTIHEGPQARKIQERFDLGTSRDFSWKVSLNNRIRKQNKFLHKLMAAFEEITEKIKEWRVMINDIGRKQSHSSDNGRNDGYAGGTAENDRGDVSGTDFLQQPTGSLQKTVGVSGYVKERIRNLAVRLAKVGRTGRQSGTNVEGKTETGRGMFKMEAIVREIEQRECSFAETEHAIAEYEVKRKKGRELDERFKRLQQRRTNAAASGGNADGIREQGQNDFAAEGIQSAIERIGREFEQRNQERRSESIEERIGRTSKETEGRNGSENYRRTDNNSPKR